jgi:eukaryotic-like serine/threonine-protein kinase
MVPPEPHQTNPTDETIATPSSFSSQHPSWSVTSSNAVPAPDRDDQPTPVPKRIGRYDIVRLIGAGGMGAVYEAIQERPRRTVAIKVMRGSIASPSLLRRFEYESQLLARLRHPGIAQVFEAGTHTDHTGELVPYFAMELIPGATPLTLFAQAHTLGTEQRIRLFAAVCDAVHHAHLRGVIHRDLKPANILVDATGQPKIIDFGVAFSQDAEAALVTRQTDQVPLIGTLQYMAPEQCSTEAADIDARADVFALGLILYELLTSKQAYALAGKPLAAVLHIVRQGEVPRASLSEPRLRGDLETIIAKAANPDRAERYDSPAALADDLERFLKHEPILARRTGVAGRVARWVRRNRAVAAVAGASALVIAVVSLILAGRIIDETRRANENLRVAQQNLRAANQNFAMIKDLFASMRPNDQQRGLVDMVQLLDGAAQRLDEKPPELPATEADFREFLAESYRGVGLYGPSIAQQRRVVDLRRKLFPDPSRELANAMHQLAAALWWNGQYDEAGSYYEQSLDMRRRLFGDKHPDVATSLTHLGAFRLRQGRLADAEDLYGRALTMRQSLPGTPDDQIAASLNNLAKAVQLRGDHARAEALFLDAYNRVVAAVGPTDIQTGHAATNLGLCLIEAGKPSQAEPYMRQAVDIRTSRYRQGHHLTNLSRLGLARAKFDQAPGPEPLAIAEEAAAALKSALPEGHPDIIDAYATVGRMHLALNDPKAAEVDLRRATDELDRSAQASPRERALTMLALAQCLKALNRPSEADRAIAQGIRALADVPDLGSLRQRLESLRASLNESSSTPAK